MSMIPGVSQAPRQSTRVALDGAAPAAEAPTALTLPLTTRSDAASSVPAAAPVQILQFEKSVVAGGGTYSGVSSASVHGLGASSRQ